MNFANSIFLEDNGSIQSAEYFPLIVTISSYIKKEEAFPTFENIMHSIYDYQSESMKITTEVFNWPYWLLKYITQFYDDVNENTLSKFSLPFASLIESQILSLKLQYQEIYHEKYNGLLLATYILMRFKSQLAITLINDKHIKE